MARWKVRTEETEVSEHENLPAAIELLIGASQHYPEQEVRLIDTTLADRTVAVARAGEIKTVNSPQGGKLEAAGG
jgi:hypothetical protein